MPNSSEVRPDNSDHTPSIPENYFSIPKEAPRELNIDALLIVLNRAAAMTALLEENGTDIKTGFTLNHREIMEAINAVGGMIEQAKQIAEHGVGVQSHE